MSSKIDNLCNDLFHAGKLTFMEWTVISQGVQDYDSGHIIRDTADAQQALLTDESSDTPWAVDESPRCEDVAQCATPPAWRDFLDLGDKPTPPEAFAELILEGTINGVRMSGTPAPEEERVEQCHPLMDKPMTLGELLVENQRRAEESMSPFVGDKPHTLDYLKRVEDALKWALDYGVTYQTALSGNGFLLENWNKETVSIPAEWQEVFESIRDENYVGKTHG